MNYKEFCGAAGPVGGHVAGFAAIVFPRADGEEHDGVAIAVMFPGKEPVWLVTQYGSALRRQ